GGRGFCLRRSHSSGCPLCICGWRISDRQRERRHHTFLRRAVQRQRQQHQRGDAPQPTQQHHTWNAPTRSRSFFHRVQVVCVSRAAIFALRDGFVFSNARRGFVGGRRGELRRLLGQVVPV